jgi:hypothetical protein
VTLNGTRGVVNLSMSHTADSSSGVDIAFQADADLSATPYSVWLDKINLTFWEAAVEAQSKKAPAKAGA